MEALLRFRDVVDRDRRLDANLICSTSRYAASRHPRKGSCTIARSKLGVLGSPGVPRKQRASSPPPCTNRLVSRSLLEYEVDRPAAPYASWSLPGGRAFFSYPVRVKRPERESRNPRQRGDFPAPAPADGVLPVTAAESSAGLPRARQARSSGRGTESTSASSAHFEPECTRP